MLQWNVRKLIIVAVVTAFSVGMAKFGVPANFSW